MISKKDLPELIGNGILATILVVLVLDFRNVPKEDQAAYLAVMLSVFAPLLFFFLKRIKAADKKGKGYDRP